MNKKVRLEVFQKRRTTTKLAEWTDRQEDITRHIQSNPPFNFTIGGTGEVSSCCLPEQEVLVGTASTITNSAGTVVGTVDSNGVPTIEYGTSSNLSVYSIATGSSTLYAIPIQAKEVQDVWFDDLRATREEHWNFTPANQIATTTALAAGTVVSARYITP